MLTDAQVQQFRTQYGLGGSAPAASSKAGSLPSAGIAPRGPQSATGANLPSNNPPQPSQDYLNYKAGTLGQDVAATHPFNPKAPNSRAVDTSKPNKANITFGGVAGSILPAMGQAVQPLAESLKGGAKNTAGIAKNVAQDVKQAGGNIVNTFENQMQKDQAYGSLKTNDPAPKQTLGSNLSDAMTGFQAAGDVSKAALSPVTETVGAGIGPVGAVAGQVADSASNIKGVRDFANTKIRDILSKANIPGDKYQQWAAEHPEAAKNLEALGNIFALGTSIPAGEAAEAMAKNGIDATAEAAKPGLANIAETAKSGLNKVKTGLENVKSATGEIVNNMKANQAAIDSAKATQDALDVVKPKMTPTEEALAKSEGRGTTTGKIFKKVSIEPSKTETEMAKYAQEAGVSSKNTFDENIQLMKDAQKESANLVRQGLKDSKAVWNKNELKGVLNKVEPPISLTQPDLPIADKLKSGIIKLVDKASKNPEGILDVRQQFDDLVEQNFGKKIFAKDDPKGILIRQYRQALNEFAESKIPDGKLANGNSLRAELRRQSLLYDAIDNVSEKAPKVGESARPIAGKIKAFTKQHPIATKVGGALIGGGIGGAVAKELIP